MDDGSGIAIAVPDEKLCPRTLNTNHSSELLLSDQW